MDRQGRGVSRLSEKAVELLRLSARQADELSMAALGTAYMQGVGVAQDHEVAAE